jgi:hypothetical protein
MRCRNVPAQAEYGMVMKLFNKQFVKLCLGVAAIAQVTGCTTFEGNAYSTPFYTYSPVTLAAPLNCVNGEYKVTIRLLPAADAIRECSRNGSTSLACFRPNEGGGLIVSAAPKDWNDRLALAMIGHETMHLCGARHEP